MNSKYSSSTLIVISATCALIGGILGAVIGVHFSSTQSSFEPNKAIGTTDITSTVIPSVVTIRARVPITGSVSQQMQERIGCGVVFDKEGHIVTNAHIVSDAKELYVRIAGKKEIPAEIIGLRKDNDLAVLKTDEPNLKVPRYGSSRNLSPGEPVLAIGKPFLISDNYTVTSGVVSSLPVDLPKGSPTLFQTDAAINPGNSGGPIINSKGEIVGIATAYLSTGDNAPGIGFAIPIDLVKQVAQEIIDSNK